MNVNLTLTMNFSQSLRINFQVAKRRNKKDEDSIHTAFNKRIVN